MDTAAGRILVVDDDPSLLKLMTAYLSRLGYQVVACDNSEAAWALVQAAPSLYSLALVDLNMPGMRGEELARRILACNATIRLIMASGYPSELSGMEALEGRVSFLHKPFAPKELAKAVGEQSSPKAD
ncbi:MAG: response regulator [Bryobacteraceae bacterium]|jgi:DNA-binding response OmpR family regulator